MPPRKFFYGDVVEIKSERHGRHKGHSAMVLQTLITNDGKRWPRVNYEVACECSTTLHASASAMSLTKRPESTSLVKDELINWQAYGFLFQNNLLGNHQDSWPARVAELISEHTLTEKFILINRYGLDGVGTLSYAEIAEQTSFSGERIRQIENEAIRKIHDANTR